MTTKRRTGFMTAAAVVLAGTTWLAVPAIATSAADDVRFLEGLRQRRLYGLAEAYCQSRLAGAQLSENAVTQLTTELIRICAERAVNAPPGQRAPYWRRAHGTASDFRIHRADNARLVLILVQDALAYLAEGELARREAEVAARPDSRLESARLTIRKAISALEEIDKQLTQLVPNAQRTPVRGALTAAQLSSLQQNVRYQLASAYRGRALCYPLQSTDRVAALTQSLDQLAKPLLELPPDDDLVPRIYLDQAVCQRLLGRHGQAERLLAELETRKLSAGTSLQIRAERARLQLSADRPQQALLVLGKGRELGGAISAELDFAHLETFVALWQAAGDAGDQAAAERWQQKSVASVEFIEQTHGRYWARRAELLLIGIGERRGTGSVEILVRTADDLFLRGKRADALLAYDKAARGARDGGQRDQAFELAYKAGLVAQQLGLHEEASRRFRELALAATDHPLAGNAHVRCIGSIAEMAKSEAARLPDYLEVLEEHVRTWPRGQTAQLVRIWLGQQYEAAQEWGLAIATYRDVPADAQQYGTAVEAAGRCWLNWAANRKAANKPVEEVATQAIAYCDGLVGNAGNEWTDAERLGAMTGAQVRLLYLDGQAAEAYELMTAALRGSPAADDAWKATARIMLIAALAAVPGKIQEALRKLQEHSGSNASDLIKLLDTTSAVAESAAAAKRKDLANVQLAAISRLQSLDAQLDHTARRRVAVLRARALVWAARLEDAIVAYRELAAGNLNDLAIQQAYADALSRADDPEHLRQALDRWRVVARRTPTHSTEWLQAKYSVALTQFKLGDKRRAAQLILYLQATEDLRANDLDKQFSELLKRCSD